MPSILRTLSISLVALLSPLGVGIATLAAKMPFEAATVTVSDVSDRPAPPAHTPDRRLAVVLFGNGGTEITDALPPTELIAASGAFDVLSVAPERRASPLLNALIQDAGADVLPHYGLDDYDAAVGAAPDLLVIPWIPAYETTDAALLPWIRANVGPHTTVLTVCAGARVLAATGLLDGRVSTGTYGMMPLLRERFPAVHWERELRWAVDGPFVSSNTLATGIDATRVAIARAAGEPAAQAALARTGYRYGEVGPELELRAGLAGFLRGAWTRRTTELGFLLEEGVRDAAVAAALDTWTASLADRARAIGLARAPVRTAAGLDLLPRLTIIDAPSLDHVESLRVPDGVFPYDHMLARIAAVEGADVAEAAADNVFYAGAGEPMEGPDQGIKLWYKPFLLAAVGAGLATRVRRAKRVVV